MNEKCVSAQRESIFQTQLFLFVLSIESEKSELDFHQRHPWLNTSLLCCLHSKWSSPWHTKFILDSNYIKQGKTDITVVR